MKFKSLLLLAALTAAGNAWALDKNGDGVYQIGTAQDLADFAALVNGGETSANAVLTSDINYTEFNLSIGTSGYTYAGEFDGQGHTITIAMENNTSNGGLFSYASGKIRNLTTTGTITGNGKFLGGLMSYSRGATIQNCVSTVTIVGQIVGDGTHGGFVGNAEGGCFVENCVFAGEIKGESTTNCGGIIGWSGARSEIKNTLVIANIGIDTSNGGSNIMGRNPGNTVCTNCYYVQPSGMAPNDGAKEITAEQVMSGAACFLLNGDQSNMAFYQNLGEDAYPLPDASHKAVGAKGGINCDGSLQGDVTFANGITTEIPEHVLDGGFCTSCGLMDVTYLSPVDGYYELASAKDLYWFAQRVNAGETTANAKLTADVDMSELTAAWTPIAPGTAYSGTFDGQNHAIENFYLETTANYGGLFAKVTGTVKNFSISGTLICNKPINGAIAFTDNAVIENVHSSLEVDCTAPGLTHSAGIVGECTNKSQMLNCTFSGTVNVGSGNSDCFGGVAGYTNTGKFVNCANYGTITCDNPGCYCGGIFGYVNNGENPGIQNCYGGGSVRCTTGDEVYVGSLVGRLRNFNPATIINNYWNENSAVMGSGENSHAAIQKVSNDQVLSGEVCYLLNGSTFVNPAWFQNLGEDDYPVLDNTHGLVYLAGEGEYADARDEASYADLKDNVIEGQKAMVANLIAQQTLLDEYLSELDKLAQIPAENFIEAYADLSTLQSQIQASAQAYVDFQKKIDETIAYLAEHDDFAGSDRDLLEDYLDVQMAMEPSEEYPNGSAGYILEQHVLSAEELAAECAAIDAMLDKAITNGVALGSDLTYKIANNDFSAGNVSGWTLTGANPYIAKVEGKGFAAEVWNGTFDLTQTIEGLPDGVYEIQMNGHFRSAVDHLNANYAGQYYANGIMNYLPIGTEDMVTPETAVDKENCFITEGANDIDYPIYNEMDEVIGYVPRGPISCTYAYSAGRYLNHMIAVVNDGTLNLGVANPGSGATDGTWFGNFRLIFRGNMAQAGEAFDATLQDMCNRAQTLINYEGSAGDYKGYPCFSQSLKDQMAETIAAVANAQSNEEKLALVQKFSDLFQSVYTCKQAYTALLKTLEIMYDAAYNSSADDLTEDQKMEMEDLFANVWGKVLDGAYTEADAREMADLKNYSGYAVIFGVIPDNIDGIFQVKTAEHLKWLATYVNAGNTNVDAVLADDIDLSVIEDWTSIAATSATPYAGVFDGQGHTITGYKKIAQTTGAGLFGYVINGTVKNLTVYGEMTSRGAEGGLIALTQGATVENVHSYLNIECREGDTHHVGGVIGQAQNYTVVSNCSFHGTMYVGAGNTDCFGGIAGYTNTAKFVNCANYGEITFESVDAYVGGIFGYVNNTDLQGLQNCLGAGKVTCTNGAGNYIGALVGWLRSYTDSRCSNNYWLEDACAVPSSGNVSASFTKATAEQMASGEITYLLNGDQSEINWYQTIGKDALPVLDPTHAVVLQKEDGTYWNEETGIQDLPMADNRSKGIYTLTGVRVSKVQQDGIYIINGKKVYVKTSK